jgi:aminopeptidase
MTLDRNLQTYAELAVRVALNLQPGQRLMIIGPLANGGASLESAPLAREITAAAYRAGSPLVETLYGDEVQQSLRFKYAPRDSFGNFSAWLPQALVEHVEAGHAVLSISANDPDLLQGEPPDLVSAVLQTSYHLYQGLLPCLLFLPLFTVFAVYYQRSRRLWPVYLAHMAMDVLAMLNHVKR